MLASRSTAASLVNSVTAVRDAGLSRGGGFCCSQLQVWLAPTQAGASVEARPPQRLDASMPLEVRAADKTRPEGAEL